MGIWLYLAPLTTLLQLELELVVTRWCDRGNILKDHLRGRGGALRTIPLRLSFSGDDCQNANCAEINGLLSGRALSTKLLGHVQR